MHDRAYERAAVRLGISDALAARNAAYAVIVTTYCEDMAEMLPTLACSQAKRAEAIDALEEIRVARHAITRITDRIIADYSPATDVVPA